MNMIQCNFSHAVEYFDGVTKDKIEAYLGCSLHQLVLLFENDWDEIWELSEVQSFNYNPKTGFWEGEEGYYELYFGKWNDTIPCVAAILTCESAPIIFVAKQISNISMTE